MQATYNLSFAISSNGKSTFLICAQDFNCHVLTMSEGRTGILQEWLSFDPMFASLFGAEWLREALVDRGAWTGP